MADIPHPVAPPGAVPCVPYSEIRPRIQSGDLLLCSGSSPMAQMIQAATHSHYSHVGLLWRLDDIARILVLESVESIGVRSVPLSHYMTNYNGTHAPYPGRVYVARHATFPSEVPPLTVFAQQAVDLLGTAYDTREIAGIALRIVAAKLGLPVRRPQGDVPLICSEFVQRCFASLGIAIAYDPRGFISPDNFATCPDITLLWALTPSAEVAV